MSKRSDTELKRVKFSTGYGLDRGKVKNRELAWFRLAEQLTSPTVDKNLTHAQYMALDPDAQAVAKNGTFVVGGHCKDGKLRKTRANVNRIICNDARIAPCIATNALTGAPHLPPAPCSDPVSVMRCGRLKALGWQPMGVERLAQDLPTLVFGSDKRDF